MEPQPVSKETNTTPSGSKKRNNDQALSLTSSSSSKSSPGSTMKKQENTLGRKKAKKNDQEANQSQEEEQPTMEKEVAETRATEVPNPESKLIPTTYRVEDAETKENEEKIHGLCKQTNIASHRNRVFVYLVKKGTNEMLPNSLSWTQLYEKDLMDSTVDLEDGRDMKVKRTPKLGYPVYGTFDGFVDREIVVDI